MGSRFLEIDDDKEVEGHLRSHLKIVMRVQILFFLILPCWANPKLPEFLIQMKRLQQRTQRKNFLRRKRKISIFSRAYSKPPE